MAKVTNEKSFNWPVAIRILALFLAVLLIGEIILSNAASVKFSSSNYKDTEQEQAAEIIESSDNYLTSDDLQRMRAVATMLGEPKTYEQYSLFSSVAIADEDYQKAIPYMEKSIELFEGSNEELSQLYVKLGCLYALIGDWNQTLAKVKQGLDINTGNTDGMLMLCEAYLNLEDYENALVSLKAYGEKTTLSESQLLAMLQLQVALEKYDDVISTCTEALKSDNYNRGTVELYLAQAYLSLGDVENARTYAEKSAADGGDKAQSDLIIAACAESGGDVDSAYAKAKEIIAAGSADYTMYDLVCQYAYSLGDYNSLVDYSSQALERDFSDSEKIIFYKWLGVGQLETNQYDEAEKNLSKYIEQDSTVAELFYLRGLCYMAAEKYDSGEADFTSALSSDELYDECLYNRALCRLKLGRDNEAADDFVEIITRNADSTVVTLTANLLSLTDEQLDAIRNNKEFSMEVTE